eukprot:gene2969-5828_t
MSFRIFSNSALFTNKFQSSSISACERNGNLFRLFQFSDIPAKRRFNTWGGNGNNEGVNSESGSRQRRESSNNEPSGNQPPSQRPRITNTNRDAGSRFSNVNSAGYRTTDQSSRMAPSSGSRRFDSPSYGSDRGGSSNRPPPTRESSDVEDYLSNDEARLSESTFSKKKPVNTNNSPSSYSRFNRDDKPRSDSFQSSPRSNPINKNTFQWKRAERTNSDQIEENDEYREPIYGYYDGDHIYGISPVKLALQAQRRNITELLVQEGMEPSNKKDQKSASDILEIAKNLNIPIRTFPKHDLNMITDNRPHQGFVLRAAPLSFKNIVSMPPSETFKCILALDEVWDPQNLGALLRTCHFLACDGVVVCAKNSAPLSPSVSKASAGAMELMEISSTTNMMRFLDESNKNGWQVIGTALDETSIDIKDIPLTKPTIVVLGNEGHGIRTNILKRCDVLVRITGQGDESAVDSLNVSVTGGILLHSILSKK